MNLFVLPFTELKKYNYVNSGKSYIERSFLYLYPRLGLDDNIIKSLELTHFMMEDYLVRILLSNPDKFFKGLKFKIASSSKMKKKISEILSLLRQQDILV